MPHSADYYRGKLERYQEKLQHAAVFSYMKFLLQLYAKRSIFSLRSIFTWRNHRRQVNTVLSHARSVDDVIKQFNELYPQDAFKGIKAIGDFRAMGDVLVELVQREKGEAYVFAASSFGALIQAYQSNVAESSVDSLIESVSPKRLISRVPRQLTRSERQQTEEAIKAFMACLCVSPRNTYQKLLTWQRKYIHGRNDIIRRAVISYRFREGGGSLCHQMLFPYTLSNQVDNESQYRIIEFLVATLKVDLLAENKLHRTVLQELRHWQNKDICDRLCQAFPESASISGDVPIFSDEEEEDYGVC